MTLLEQLLVLSILACLGAMLSISAIKIGSHLKYQASVIQTFHNGRIDNALRAEQGDWNPDVGFADGSYNYFLKLK